MEGLAYTWTNIVACYFARTSYVVKQNSHLFKGVIIVASDGIVEWAVAQV